MYPVGTILIKIGKYEYDPDITFYNKAEYRVIEINDGGYTLAGPGIENLQEGWSASFVENPKKFKFKKINWRELICKN